ncbi:hypothetical protein [Pseudanabaena sp. PCC 6802]|uniref:hypothetical protein n=1 Tax=Pseudanabaena sp. PCC 6802 TaxID=118173 RepID=UPI00034982C3|nr:hypothetical protein [Pseudanabaena sp. PCC 6802]
MFGKKPHSSQSISINGGQVSGLVGVAGENLVQIQHDSQASGMQVVTQQRAVELLEELEELLKMPALPLEYQNKALRYLGAAKEESQTINPDKQFTADSLKKVAGVLKEANETIEASQGIWQKVQPILNQLLSWLGFASNLLG